jgi:hypothetical protein
MGVGGERSTLLRSVEQTELRHFSRRGLNPRPPSACADGALTEVTGIFTTACRDALQRLGIGWARWGTGDIGVSDVNTGVLAERLRCGAWQPLVRAPPQCVSQRRESNPLFQGTKYPVSSPPALVEPRTLARMRQTKIVCGACRAALLRTPKSPLCHRCPAHRLVPSGRPRALGHARFRASPGIRVSRSGLKPGKQIQRACAAVGQQKTLRSIWLGRVRVRSANCRSRLRRDRSHEPGTRYRSA